MLHSNTTRPILKSVVKWRVVFDLYWQFALSAEEDFPAERRMSSWQPMGGPQDGRPGELFSFASARTLTSSGRSLLTIPPTTSTYGDRAFSVSAQKLWDILPEDIKVSPKVNIFKKRLKMYLFSETVE